MTKYKNNNSKEGSINDIIIIQENSNSWCGGW